MSKIAHQSIAGILRAWSAALSVFIGLLGGCCQSAAPLYGITPLYGPQPDYGVSPAYGVQPASAIEMNIDAQAPSAPTDAPARQAEAR